MGDPLETLEETPWAKPQPAPISAPSSAAADLEAAKEAAAEKLAADLEAAKEAAAEKLAADLEADHLLPSIPGAALPHAYDLEILRAGEDRIAYLRLGPRWAVEIVVREESDARIDLEQSARPPGRAALLEAARQLAAEIREVDAAALAAAQREIEELREEVQRDTDPELLALLAARLIRLCEPALAREIVDWIQERISRAPAGEAA